ncbi:hypothetical protein N7526_010555 [Penicillium atrosanguineum]|nr:hypothetical protein N7526_010555 [Penicillium atrosanguineum]
MVETRPKPMVGSAMDEDTLLARVNVMVSLCTKKLDQYSNRDHTIITCANEVNTLAALKSTMMHRDILPPGKRNMDDTFVYAVKQLETQASCKKYEGVFDGNGHLHIDRKPSGNSVVVPAFGVKWLLFMGGPLYPYRQRFVAALPLDYGPKQSACPTRSRSVAETQSLHTPFLERLGLPARYQQGHTPACSAKLPNSLERSGV